MLKFYNAPKGGYFDRSDYWLDRNTSYTLSLDLHCSQPNKTSVAYWMRITKYKTLFSMMKTLGVVSQSLL